MAYTYFSQFLSFMPLLSQKEKSAMSDTKQAWHWPYEAPGLLGSGLYDITIVCGPKDISLKKYILIS